MHGERVVVDTLTPANGAPVVLIGSACCDVRAVAGASLISSHTQTGSVRLALGGTARNIAENLARLDLATHLIAATGDDEPGHQILDHTRAAGVQFSDTASQLMPGRASGIYLTIINEQGDLLTAIDDTAITRTITPRVIHRQRQLLRTAAFVVADATLRPQTLATIVRLCTQWGVPLCLEPVSERLARKLLPFICDAALLTPNMREAAALTGLPVRNHEEALVAARTLRDQGVETVVVTMARAGAVYVDANGSGHVPAMQTEPIDTVGTGDAQTAGLLFGLRNGFPLDEAVTFGTALASLTMQTTEAVVPGLTLDGVYAHLQS